MHLLVVLLGKPLSIHPACVHGADVDVLLSDVSWPQLVGANSLGQGLDLQ